MGDLNLLPFLATGPCTGGIGTGTVGSLPCRYSVHCRRTSKVAAGRRSAAASVSCSAASAQAPPSQSTIKISGMEEALEIPVLNYLTMVLGSIAQTRAAGVVVDFSEPSSVYDNVKQKWWLMSGEWSVILVCESDTAAGAGSGWCSSAKTRFAGS